MYPVAGGVLLGVAHSVGDDLNADKLPAFTRHRQTDRACAAVEIEQQLAAGERGVFASLLIELLRLSAVDLPKGEGRYLEGHAAEHVLDRAAAVGDSVFTAEYDICFFSVRIKNDRFELWQSFAEVFDQDILVLQAVAVDHITDHQLACHLSQTDIEVAQPALARTFVIDGDIIGVDEFARDADHLAELLRLQSAVGTVDDAVAVEGVEADQQPSVPVPSDGELRLIAVAVGFLTGYYRSENGLYPADALHGVADLLLLDAAFLSVGDVTPHAAAALTEHRTVRLDAGGGRRDDLLDAPEGIGFLDLHDPHHQRVAHSGLRNKYRRSVLGASYAAALGGG